MCGMGGVGKTTLANHFIHHTASSFKAWFNAESIDNLKGQYIDLAIAMHLYRLEDKSILERSDKIEVVSRIKQCLKDQPGWILVYDNVEKYEDIKALLPQSGGHIIITSRHSKWPIGTTIDIDVMEEEEAVALVKNTTNTKEDEAIIKELAEEKLGLLPLAISQACGYIKANRNMSIKEYLNLYGQYTKELLASDKMPPGEIHPSISITFEINFQKIEKNSQEAMTFLNVCAFLDAAGISEEILLTYFEEQGIDCLKYNDAKAALLEYCLIKTNDDKNISIHRLVQQIIRYQVMQNKDTMQELYSKLLVFFEKGLEDYEKILSSEKGPLDLKRKEYLRQLFVHAEVISRYINHEILTKQSQKSYAVVLTLLGSWFSWRHADFVKKRAYYEKALAIRTLYKIEDPLDFAGALINLGSVFMNEREVEKAKSHYEQGLAILRSTHGNDNLPYTANALMGLGEVFSNQGAYAKARCYYEQVLTMRCSIHEDSNDSRPYYVAKANAYEGLGDLSQKQGAYAEAKSHYGQSLAILRSIHGNDNHSNVAGVLIKLGNVFMDEGEVETAKSHYEQNLAILLSIHGSDNYPDVASALISLGSVFFISQGGYKKAREYYEQGLAILRRIHGNDNHSDVAGVLINLGNVFMDEGEVEKAKSHYEQGLAILRSTHGNDNRSYTANALMGLGKVFSNQGAYAEAKSHYEQSLAILRRIHGNDNHPYTAGVLDGLRYVATSFKNLGDIFYGENNYPKAEEHYQEALSIYQIIHDSDNYVDVANSYRDLGSVYCSQETYAKARECYQKELNIYRTLGNNPISENRVLDDLRYVAMSLDNLREEQALETQIKRERDAKENSLEKESVSPFVSSNSMTPSIGDNPYQFYGKPMEASILNLNAAKEFGNYLKITKEVRGQETVYEFNLTDLWQNLDETQNQRLREAIEKLHSKNRGETISNGNITKISFLKEDAQNLLDKLKEILTFDNSVLPGEKPSQTSPSFSSELAFPRAPQPEPINQNDKGKEKDKDESDFDVMPLTSSNRYASFIKKTSEEEIEKQADSSCSCVIL